MVEIIKKTQTFYQIVIISLYFSLKETKKKVQENKEKESFYGHLKINTFGAVFIKPKQNMASLN